MIVTLPYPPSGLNPNRPGHWAKKHRIGQDYRWACEAAMGKHRKALKGKSLFKITFAPPDNIRRDMDNAIAAIKRALDQVSKRTGIDDSKFRIAWPSEFLPPVKGGAVYLEIIG